MKNLKIALALLLVASMAVLSACGGGTPSTKDYSDEVDALVVDYPNRDKAIEAPGHLTEMPNYTLPETATEDEVRAMAVKAMNDELTFVWTPLQPFKFTESAGASRNLDYNTNAIYGGLPYNNVARSLFHALEGYDYEKGVIYDLAWNSGNNEFGNTCANSVIWGLVAVCPSITASSTHTVTPHYGFAPIGDIQMPPSMVNYTDALSTDYIIAENGDAVVLEAYAQMKPADTLLSHGSPNCGNHCMMVTGVNVVRNSDGSINPDESTLQIQDQWGSHYMQDKVTYCGRHKEFNFAYFLENDYLPLTCEEFKNYKGHEVTKVEVIDEATSYADAKKTKVQANYRIVVLRSYLVSESGTTVLVKSHRNTKYDTSISLSPVVAPAKEMKSIMHEDRTYTLKAEAVLANGDVVQVMEIPVTMADVK